MKDKEINKSKKESGKNTNEQGTPDKDRIQWHTGFVQAMRLYLKDYEDELEFNDEFQLTRKPLSIDLTVIKKPDDLVITNRIGSFFKKHNILEYKSPRDELNLETFYKVQAYALLYMIAPDNCDTYGSPVAENDITITIVRAAYPRELMKDLAKLGYHIHEDVTNLYQVDGAQFPIQIAVTKPDVNANDNDDDMIWLNALSENISKETYSDFLSNMNQLDTKHSMFAESIFAIVSSVNEQNIENWKGDKTMNDAMKRIMAKELKESKDEGIAEGHSAGLAEGHSAGLAEGHSAGLAEGVIEGRTKIKDAMLAAKENHLSEASELEALGYDKDTSASTIFILKELGVIS